MGNAMLNTRTAEYFSRMNIAIVHFNPKIDRTTYVAWLKRKRIPNALKAFKDFAYQWKRN